MSLRYNNKNGVETIVSGITPGGNMETGAVAMREGIIDCPGSSSQDYCQVAVTFSDPMPDGDYIVEIQPKQGSWEKQQWTCTEKTATGFMFVVYNVNRTAPYNATKFNYKAFKPYEVADAEELYSSVQDIEAMIPSTASSTNKFATANDLRTETRSLDRRLDDVEDCVPSSASISNQLVTATQLETAINNVEIDIDDQIDSTSENPVQNKVIYNALQNVEIDVDSALSGTSENPVQNKVVKGALDKKEDAQFTGTQAQWDALSTTQKKAYKIANITDDVIGGEVADEVTDGDMRPVTSNAVYDGLAAKVETSDVVNNLTSTSTTAPLSAAQGKVLNDTLTGLVSTSWSANSGFSYVRIGKMVIFRLRATMPSLTQSDSVRWTGTKTGVVPSAVTPKSAFSTTGMFTYLGLNGSISLTFNTNLSVTFEVVTTNNTNPYNNWYECVGMYEIN